MSRRNQPYIPLYVQDFQTDEKLMECSASATGVYIRLMCIMHKSETYGTILLKQKDKQSDKQVLNFAYKVAKFLPYDLVTIEEGISELLDEKVLEIDGDLLIQKRMVKDGNISEARAKAGSKGGINSSSRKKKFAQAKNQANPEDENEDENEDVSKKQNGVKNPKPNKFQFEKELINYGAKEEIARDFLEVRKKKNAANTETAFTLLINQVKLSGKHINDCLLMAIEKNWQTYKAEWDKNQQGILSQFKPPSPTMVIKPTGTMQKLQEMDEKYPKPAIKS